MKRPRQADTTFFVEPDKISAEAILIDGDNYRHAIKVLRQDVGSVLEIIDGTGVRYRAVIEEIKSRAAMCSIVDRKEDDSDIPKISIVVGQMKSADRFEMLVEKAVELGVSEILVVRTARSQGRRFREDRIHRIAVAALKQSLRTRLPEIKMQEDLRDVIAVSGDEVRLLFSMRPDAVRFANVLDDARADEAFRIVVGPEGGLTEEEEEFLISSGFVAVSLGHARLRVETAALVAIACIVQATV